MASKRKTPVVKYWPVTPGGTACTWLMADTEEQAWKNLLRDAAHMPYKGVDGFKARGYIVVKATLSEAKR